MNFEDFNAFGFSGGERHVELTGMNLPASQMGTLTARIRNSSDLMDLILITDVLRERGIQPAVLDLPYMPYARQDRRTTDWSPFSLKVVANLVNDLGYRKVRVYEPHSVATSLLINSCEVVTFDRAAQEFINSRAAFDAVLLAPDAGAVPRTERVAQACGLPMAIAIKKRDPQTGRLRIVDVFGDIDGRSVIVLDDICDGGATFIQLAEFVAGRVDLMRLFVAHGIFSKGIEPLREYYHEIGTTDSFYQGSEVEVYQSL